VSLICNPTCALTARIASETNVQLQSVIDRMQNSRKTTPRRLPIWRNAQHLPPHDNDNMMSH
jgi:hypothetical protein